MLFLKIVLAIQVYLIFIALLGSCISRGGRYESEFDGKDIHL